MILAFVKGTYYYTTIILKIIPTALFGKSIIINYRYYSVLIRFTLFINATLMLWKFCTVLSEKINYRRDIKGTTLLQHLLIAALTFFNLFHFENH